LTTTQNVIIKGVTVTNTRRLTLPTSTTIIVVRDTTNTLTNKTLTAPIIFTIINSETLTLPTSATTIVVRDTTGTFTNKTIIGTTKTVEASELRNGSKREWSRTNHKSS